MERKRAHFDIYIYIIIKKPQHREKGAWKRDSRILTSGFKGRFFLWLGQTTNNACGIFQSRQSCTVNIVSESIYFGRLSPLGLDQQSTAQVLVIRQPKNWSTYLYDTKFNARKMKIFWRWVWYCVLGGLDQVSRYLFKFAKSPSLDFSFFYFIQLKYDGRKDPCQWTTRKSRFN